MRYIFILVYVVLTVLLLPLFGSGYLLTLDMVFAPPFPDWLQKLMLLLILALIGIGAHLLASTFKTKDHPIYWRYAPFLSGLLYLLNPFVYSRFMTGQWRVLLGYALLPFFLRSVILFLRQPTWQKAVFTGLWLVGIGIASLHTVGIGLIAAVVFAAVHWWPRRRNKQWLKAAGLGGLLSAGIAVLASSYWLIPALFGQGKTVSTIANFNSADLAAFATNSNNLGLLGNVLALQGFWADAKDLYLIPQDLFNWWWLHILALWLLVAYGIFKSWQQQRGITVGFVALIIIGAILAIGTAGTIAAPFNQWLIDHIPFFAGYREPQKFVMLIALAYAFFAAVAAASLLQTIKTAWPRIQRYAPLALTPLLLIPAFAAPLMFNGFAGQLTPRQYPADWYAMDDYLKTNAPGQKVLFLPWHLYMRFNFAGRVIANPADKFFTNPLVMSNDPEMDGAKSYASTPEQQEIQSHILPAAKAGGKNMAAELKKLGINYVLLAKELDFTTYSFLDEQPGFMLLKESSGLKLLMLTGSIGEGV